jgi:hypothetical protein
VFVNLHNNMWNTNFRFWQEGSWSTRVKFWPLSDCANMGEELAIRGWEVRLPLLVGAADGPAGMLPVLRTGLTLSRPGVLATAFGEDPDGNPGTLLRLWEQSGISGDVTVTLPDGLPATGALPVNLRGQAQGKPLAVVGRSFHFHLPAFTPASFILRAAE